MSDAGLQCNLESPDQAGRSRSQLYSKSTRDRFLTDVLILNPLQGRLLASMTGIVHKSLSEMNFTQVITTTGYGPTGSEEH